MFGAILTSSYDPMACTGTNAPVARYRMSYNAYNENIRERNGNNKYKQNDNKFYRKKWFLCFESLSEEKCRFG